MTVRCGFAEYLFTDGPSRVPLRACCAIAVLEYGSAEPVGDNVPHLAACAAASVPDVATVGARSPGDRAGLLGPSGVAP
jgi:hypothetical protein